jgi:hypothetical protein
MEGKEPVHPQFGGDIYTPLKSRLINKESRIMALPPDGGLAHQGQCSQMHQEVR